MLFNIVAIMYKTIEAYYKNGKIVYKEAMPPVKKAKLLITIVDEEPHKIPKLSRFKGIFKKKIDGMQYQKKIRSK
jgi:hypothetical protein